MLEDIEEVCDDMSDERQTPLISVLMGVRYQRESLFLLERAILSIQDQTYSNWELLICDDGSTEAARQYMEETATLDTRVHLVRNCPKTDLASKLNWCLKEAKGSYIARMDDDDRSYAQRFEKQICFLAENPIIAFIGSNVRLWCDGCVVGVRKLPKKPEIRDFLFVQPFVHPTIIFRVETLLAVGGYSEDKHCLKCEDYDLLLRLYEYGYQGVNLQECLLDYTITGTAKGGRTMKDRCNEVVTRFMHFQKLKLLPGALPYVIKPILVGLLPKFLLGKLKEIVKRSDNEAEF